MLVCQRAPPVVMQQMPSESHADGDVMYISVFMFMWTVVDLLEVWLAL